MTCLSFPLEMGVACVHVQSVSRVTPESVHSSRLVVTRQKYARATARSVNSTHSCALSVAFSNVCSLR